jgi:SAM-dependent methyltransferase
MSEAAGELLSGGLLNLDFLARKARKPSLFEPGDACFWTDSYISHRCLETHLDPTTEQGSRKPRTIAATVEWIARITGLGQGARVLDLGCGPGLYCREFARRGWQVTGMDFSEASVAYARAQTPAARFLCGDYLRTNFGRSYDLITLIYGDLGVLSNRDRDKLLRRIARALAPGGFFVFDVFTHTYLREEGRQSSWHVGLEGGFWRPGPYLVLEQSLNYPRAQVVLERYLVCEPEGHVTRYHIWKHHYRPDQIRSILERRGFSVLGQYADLTGTPYHEGAQWIGVAARVPPFS